MLVVESEVLREGQFALDYNGLRLVLRGAECVCVMINRAKCVVVREIICVRF